MAGLDTHVQVPKTVYVRWYCESCKYHHEVKADKAQLDSVPAYSVLDLGTTDLRCKKLRYTQPVQEPKGFGAVVIADSDELMYQTRKGRRRWISNGAHWFPEGAPFHGNGHWVWAVEWKDLVDPQVWTVPRCTCGDRPDMAKHALRCPLSDEKLPSVKCTCNPITPAAQHSAACPLSEERAE